MKKVYSVNLVAGNKNAQLLFSDELVASAFALAMETTLSNVTNEVGFKLEVLEMVENHEDMMTLFNELLSKRKAEK